MEDRQAFGELTDKSGLANALVAAAQNVVEDNAQDYFSAFMNCREGSPLAKLEELEVAADFYAALRNSVSFMQLRRCGIDADAYIGIGNDPF